MTRMQFYEYLTKPPPVVETNNNHGSIPHPSFAVLVPSNEGTKLIQQHIESSDRGDDSTNEILIMPLKSNASLGRGHHVPLFPMPESNSSLSLFILFLGSVTEGESAEEEMQRLRQHHRSLYQSATTTLGGKRYSYDTITTEVLGESAWKRHHGDLTWHQMCVAKRRYDPFDIFGSGLHIWE